MSRALVLLALLAACDASALPISYGQGSAGSVCAAPGLAQRAADAAEQAEEDAAADPANEDLQCVAECADLRVWCYASGTQCGVCEHEHAVCSDSCLQG